MLQLGEGALTAAFIPIFKEKEKTHGEIEMWRAANAVISGLVVAAASIIGVVMLGISLALAVHQFERKTELMLRLLRVMFPYMLLVCLAAAFMGMLNARGHFFIPAMGATMLNVVMIASVLWLAPQDGIGQGTKARTDFRAGHRRAGGGRGAGGVSTADALARRLPLPLGFAVAQ
jgi:putative peptidoglycan lipid II flippase